MVFKNEKIKSYVIAFLLLILVGVGVGYAAIFTTLKITGTSTIQNNNWGIAFSNVSVTEGSVTATKAAAVTGSTLIDYEISLALPGDFYEFTTVVRNTGTIDAKVENLPTLTGVSSDQDVYVNYTITYADGSEINKNDVLAAEQTATIKVRVEFDKNITAEQLPTTNQTLSLGFSMNYVQAD